MSETVPHPRHRHDLIGHAAAAAALLGAEQAGRLPHAWLIGGSEGIGKATLAYRFARFLIASSGERLGGADGLAVDPNSRTARQMAAGANPNLVVLEREVPEDGKPAPRVVDVKFVRKALTFFQSTAADGGRRICIIDSVDDLNVQGANALLKVIEEPPARALILIVSHAPQRVLPTIRSRCRKLILPPLTTAEVRTVLASLDLAGEGEGSLAERAAAMSDGSVGRALTLYDARRVAFLDEIASLLGGLPAVPMRRVLALGDKLSDKKRADDFPLAVDAMLRWLADRVEARQENGAARLAPLAELCESLTESARQTETYNLDRRAFLVTTFGDLAEAVRRAG